MSEQERPGTLVRASAALLVSRLVAATGYFVAALLIARALGPAHRGAFAFVSVGGLLTGSLAPLGIGRAFAVQAARDASRRAELIASGAAWGAVSGLVAGGLVSAGGLLLPDGSLPAGVGVAALAWMAVTAAMIAASGVVVVTLRGAGLYGPQSVVTAVAPWIYAALLATARASNTLDLGTAIEAWSALWSAYAAGTVLVVVRTVGLGPARARTVIEAMPFALRAWVGTLSSDLNQRLDQVLMGFLASASALGVYAVAVNVSEVLLYLPEIIAIVLLPAIARSAPERRADTTLEVARRLLAVVTVTSLAAAAAGPLLVPLLFGHAYDGAVVPFLLLVPGALGYALLVTFSSALVASDAPGGSSQGPLVALVSGAILDVALVPSFGAPGAAIAASSAFLVGGAAAAAAYRRHTPFPLVRLLPTHHDVAALLAFRQGASAPAAAGSGRLARVRSARVGRAKSAIVRGQAAWWIIRRGRAPAGGLRILTYHRVSTDRDELAVTPARFRRQIEAIAGAGVPVVDLGRALAGDGSPAIALTFDDGYHDFVENALPVLVEHGLPATVFVCPDIIDGSARFAFYDQDAHPAMLSWEEMRAIERDTGVRFEPHSLTHPDMGALDDDDAWREVDGSRSVLAAQLGREPRLFCYPGGYATGRDAALVERAGLAAAVTTEDGVNGADQPRYWLRRTSVDRYDPLWVFQARLRGALDRGVLGRRRRASA